MDGFIQFFEREIRHYLFPEFFVVEIHGLEAVQMIKQKQREDCSGAESAVRVVEHRDLPRRFLADPSRIEPRSDCAEIRLVEDSQVCHEHGGGKRSDIQQKEEASI